MKRIPCPVLCAALALAVLTTGTLAHDDDQDHEKGVRQELQALKAQVAALQATVAALQTQLTNAKNVLALAPFVSVDPNPQVGVAGPNITFSGVNLHLVSGSGMTNDNGHPTGLGNLIIGYDEDSPQAPSFPLKATAAGRTTWSSGAGIASPRMPLAAWLQAKSIPSTMREPLSSAVPSTPPVVFSPSSSAAAPTS